MQFSARRTVIPNPANRGGYSRYDRPDPNEGQFGNLYGATLHPSLAETSSRADEYHRNFDAARQEQQWESPSVSSSQRIMNRVGDSKRAPADRRMDAFFQVLQDKGVTRLAADAVTPGGSPSFFGDQFGHGGTDPGASVATAPAGYTHQRAMDELRNWKPNGQSAPGFMTTPGGAPAQLTPGNNKYIQNILDGLRNQARTGRPFYGYR